MYISHSNKIAYLRLCSFQIVPLLLVLLVGTNSFSQTKREIDSLINVLVKLPLDSNKVNTLNKLSNKTKNLNYTESKEYADKALELSKAIDFEKGMLEAYTNIGYCYSYTVDNALALESLDKALHLANKLNDMKQKVIIFNYYYLLYNKIDSYDKAAEYAFKALDVAESIDFDAGIAALYINIGNLYLNQLNYEKSKKYFLQALEIAEKINHRKKIAIININLGTIFFDKGNFEEALDYYHKAMDTYQELENHSRILRINMRIGDVLQVQHKGEQATIYYMESLSLAEELNDSTLISMTCFKLAYCFNGLNLKDSAYYYASRAYEISIKFENILNTNESSYLLYKLNYEDGNYKDACDYLDIYRQMTDRLNAKEKFITLNNLEAQYVLKKHEKEIKLIELEKSMIKLKGLFLIILVIFISVIIIQRLNKKRLKNKKDKEIFFLKLSKTKSELEQKKAELKAFTLTIIEKNKKIDELHGEIAQVEKIDNIKDLNIKREELRNLRILTEDDWIKFKSIFTEVYSEFTIKIDHIDPNLSEGDKRQIMLIKLGFSINQSAEILGVGYKAIQKARQRLAQKLNLENSKELNVVIENLS
ncbi:MAG: hypothetical protein DRJ05_06100 [Bacteroidetes bacterium]|nr:MAG: hypothetical protein DRJ05_06100 [Bacteroidota bacterium]